MCALAIIKKVSKKNSLILHTESQFSWTVPRGAIIWGKTGKTAVLPWFCKIECGSGGALPYYGGLSLHGRARRAGGTPGNPGNPKNLVWGHEQDPTWSLEIVFGCKCMPNQKFRFFPIFLTNGVWIDQAKSWKWVMFKTLMWQLQWFQMNVWYTIGKYT
jgi:hypothetical protein